MKVLVIDNNSDYFNKLLGLLDEKNIDYFVRKPLDEINKDFCCVIASGGKLPKNEKNIILEWYRRFLFNLNKPFFGICLAHKILGYIYGAKILYSHEKGFIKIKFFKRYPLVPYKDSLIVYQDHDFGLGYLSEKLINYASSSTCNVQAIKVVNKPQFGVQFHPELDENYGNGKLVLENFLRFAGVI